MTKIQLDELILLAGAEADKHLVNLGVDDDVSAKSKDVVAAAFRTGFYRGADAAVRMLEQKEAATP